MNKSIALCCYFSVLISACGDAERISPDYIASKLPPRALADSCVMEIGQYKSESPSLASHHEGAIGKNGSQHILISGFSDFREKTLLASSKVSLLQRDELTWQTMNIPAPIIGSHIQGASSQGKIWIAGGFIGSNPGKATDAVWSYDVKNENWSNFTPLPRPLASGAFVAFNNALHFISGLEADRNTASKDHLVFDLKKRDGWKVRTKYPAPRNHFQAVSLGEFLFAIGGQTGHDEKPVDVNTVDVYLPEKNVWHELTPMPETKSHAESSTFVHKNRIYVAGGRSDRNFDKWFGRDYGHSSDSILEYNPYTNSWRKVGILPLRLLAPFVRVIDDRLYISGGAHKWNQLQKESWSAAMTYHCTE